MIKIVKIVADGRPSECLMCPLILEYRPSTKVCGMVEKRTIGNKTFEHKVPDARCLVEVEG